MTTWRHLISHWDPQELIAVAPDPSVLDVDFDDGYGCSEGPEFLAWDRIYVYFPVVYDGSEWVGRAPRDPRSTGQPHVGGE